MNSTPETQTLLTLTEKSYEEYNSLLPIIKSQLGSARTSTFEQVLKEELPLTTCRRAYRTAIRVAMGESEVPREFHPKKGTK